MALVSDGGVTDLSTRRVGYWDLLLAAGPPGALSGLSVVHYVPRGEMVVAWHERRHARWLAEARRSAADVRGRASWLKADVRRWRREARAAQMLDPAEPGRAIPIPGSEAVWLPTTLCRIDNRRWLHMVTAEAVARGEHGHDQPGHDLDEVLCEDCVSAVALGADGAPEAGSLREFLELTRVG